MRKNPMTIAGVHLGSKCGLDMADLIATQLDRDGARPKIFYWHRGDLDAELMAEAIATIMQGRATMIPNGTMLADVQFCLDDVEANQGKFAVVGSYFDGVVPHLRYIAPKKGTKEDSAFKVLEGIEDGSEVQVITMNLPATKSKGCPTATKTIVRPGDDAIIATVGEQRKMAVNF